MKIACLNLDRLVSVAIRPLGMPRADLYELYKLLDKDGPISYQIANALLERRGAKVGIISGAADKVNFPNGESDGPPGAVAMARALERLGYDVTIYTEEPCVMGMEEMKKVLGCKAPVEVLELDLCNHYHEIAKKLDIAIITEKLGMNEMGYQHSVTGRSREGHRAKVDYIILEMNAMGKLTVGIGDGGNEVGFGKVYEAARKLIPLGEQCICGCGGGIITTTPTTFLYPVSISNWGAYALCAALALATGDKSLIVQPEEEEKILRRCIEIELVDGGSGRPAYALDGVDGASSVGCVTLMKEIVELTGTTTNRAF
ncbi:MAG: DUF4392 domain-containing protein [Clostridiales bacterium]|nr:DUF4392 domain-containing protein [Clostridiales bacterium]